MKHILLLLGLTALASCRTPVSPAISAASPATPPAQPFTLESSSELLHFHYHWPEQAAAIPLLAARLRSEMETWRGHLLATATADQQFRNKSGFPFHPYEGIVDWTAGGQSARLLSLSSKLYEYTGGAHGNHGTHALLWDRALAGEVAFNALFADSEVPAHLLLDRWCNALDAARATKRGEHAIEGGEFNRCPALSELATVPTDGDNDGRFDAVTLTADPYVAGPYVEGEYAIALPVKSEFIAALKPGYRASFEAQPQ